MPSSITPTGALFAFVIHIVAKFGTASILAGYGEFFLVLAPFGGRCTLGNRATSFLGSLFSVTLELCCSCVIETK